MGIRVGPSRPIPEIPKRPSRNGKGGEKMAEIKLGDKVKDVITGFEGIAIAKAEYLNGCIRFEIKPEKLKDSKTTEAEWIDIQQLKVVKAGFFKTAASAKPPGGPQCRPASLSTPK